MTFSNRNPYRLIQELTLKCCMAMYIWLALCCINQVVSLGGFAHDMPRRRFKMNNFLLEYPGEGFGHISGLWMLQSR